MPFHFWAYDLAPAACYGSAVFMSAYRYCHSDLFSDLAWWDNNHYMTTGAATLRCRNAGTELPDARTGLTAPPFRGDDLPRIWFTAVWTLRRDAHSALYVRFALYAYCGAITAATRLRCQPSAIPRHRADLRLQRCILRRCLQEGAPAFSHSWAALRRSLWLSAIRPELVSVLPVPPLGVFARVLAAPAMTNWFSFPATRRWPFTQTTYCLPAL